MTAWSDGPSRWLIDYYAAASVVLAAAALAGCLVRAAAARVALGRAALVGLAILAVLCAAPAWPRFAVLSASNEAAAIAQPSPAASPPATLLPAIAQLPVAPIGAHKTDGGRAAVSRDVGAFRRSRAASNRRAAFRLADQATRIVVAFLVGAALLFSRLLFGAIQVRRLGRGASHAPESAHEELRRIAGPGVRLPRLLVSSAIDTAGVWGLLRPTIALPERAMRSGLAVGPILAHEWAHIRRGDLWALALVRGLQTLLYAHPLYWIVRRRLRDDQEIVADASAADLWGRCEYAAALVGWARFQSKLRLRANGVLWISEHRTLLSRRISMLLDERIRLPLDCGRRWRLGSGLASLTLVAGLSVFTLHAMPDTLAAPPVKRPEKVAAKITRPATPAAKASDAEQAEIAGVVAISGICRDEKQAPLAGVRVQLFRTELSDVAHLRPTGRIKMVQSFVGPVEGFSAGNYGTSMEDPESQRALAETTTDAAGSFTFAGLAADPAWTGQRAVVMVVVQAPGKGTKCDRAMLTRRTDRSPAVEPLQFTLPAAASLRGRVVDEEGKPVAGAVVSCPDACGLAKPLPGVMCTVTDAQGRFEIADLPPFDAADAQPVVSEFGVFAAASAAVSIEHANFAPLAVEYERLPATIEATLQRPAVLEGQVVDEESGKPAEHATVYWSHERGFSGSAIADQDGRYAVQGLPPGKYVVRAYHADRLDVTHESKLQPGANKLDLRLEGGGFIKGIVIDEATGKPPVFAAGVQMTIHAMPPSGQPSEVRVGYVQHDGTFSMKVRPGKNSLVFFHPRWRLTDETSWREAGVDVAKGQTVEVTLRIRSQRPTLFVAVPAVGGNPANDGAPRAQPLSDDALQGLLKNTPGILLETESIEGREAITGINLGGPYESVIEESALQLTWISQQVFARIQAFPKLRRLTLYPPPSTDAALKSLRGLNNIDSLQFFGDSDVTSAGAAHLASLENLTVVALSGPQLDDEALEQISRLAKLKLLAVGGAFTDDGLRSLVKLAGLEQLVLQSEKITDAGLAHLGDIEQLKELDLECPGVSEAGIAALKARLPELKVHVAGQNAARKSESPND